MVSAAPPAQEEAELRRLQQQSEEMEQASARLRFARVFWWRFDLKRVPEHKQGQTHCRIANVGAGELLSRDPSVYEAGMSLHVSFQDDSQVHGDLNSQVS